MQVELHKEASHKRVEGTCKTSISKIKKENELRLRFTFFLLILCKLYRRGEMSFIGFSKWSIKVRKLCYSGSFSIAVEGEYAIL